MSIIKLSKLNKEYKGKVVFKNFDLDVEQGEFLVVTGKSGAGKTTLLNIIGLLENPDNGTVTILNDTNPHINKRDGRLLMKDHIGYLFQNFALVENYTAKKNIELVCKLKKISFSDENVQKVIHKLGIEDLMDKKIFQLSGGEQQRVALARLFIKEPTILLADEPTASLDPENSEIVLNAIEELHKKGTTIILVTHNPDIVKRASRTVQIQ